MDEAGRSAKPPLMTASAAEDVDSDATAHLNADGTDEVDDFSDDTPASADGVEDRVTAADYGLDDANAADDDADGAFSWSSSAWSSTSWDSSPDSAGSSAFGDSSGDSTSSDSTSSDYSASSDSASGKLLLRQLLLVLAHDAVRSALPSGSDRPDATGREHVWQHRRRRGGHECGQRHLRRLRHSRLRQHQFWRRKLQRRQRARRLSCRGGPWRGRSGAWQQAGPERQARPGPAGVAPGDDRAEQLAVIQDHVLVGQHVSFGYCVCVWHRLLLACRLQVTVHARPRQWLGRRLLDRARQRDR